MSSKGFFADAPLWVRISITPLLMFQMAWALRKRIVYPPDFGRLT